MTKEHDYRRFTIAAILCALFAISMVMWLASCTTAHKAVKYMDNHTAVSSDYCSIHYPCKDSVSERVEYREGTTTTVHDSLLQLLHDTLTNTNTRTVIRTVTVTHVDTVERDRIIYQSDKALQISLGLKLAASVQQAKDYQATAVKWRKWAYIGWGILIILVAASCVRLYLKMIKP